MVAYLSVSTGAAQNSQPARIYSGEHEAFTRLALVFSQPTEWRVEDIDRGYRVSFSPNPGEIDLRRVFDLIPRTRITSVEQDPADGSLILASTCDCEIEAFEAQARTLALDVKDAPSPGPDAGQASIEADLRSQSGDSNGAAGEIDREGTRPPLALLPDPALSAPAVAGQSERGLVLAIDPGTLAAGAEIAARLQEDMRRAAQAGLVDLSPGSIMPPAAPAPADPDPPGSAETRAAEMPGVALPLMSLPRPANMEVRLGRETEPRRAAVPDGHPACPSEAQFAFLEERSASELLEGLPALRATLADDAGGIQEGPARALIETYLGLTLGLEAEAIMARFPLRDGPQAEYRSLARILETGRDETPEVWAGLQRCPSPAALWAFLGHVPANDAQPTDTAALQRAFFALPVHLRRHLGPGLVALLRRRGHVAAAAAVDANLANLVALADTSVGSPARPSKGSPPDPPSLSTDRPSRAVDVLIERAFDRMRTGRLPTMVDLETSEALAREHAGTPRGDKLMGLVGLHRLATGDYGGAAEALESAGGPDSEWTASLDRTVRAGLSALPDGHLLELVLHVEGPGLIARLTTDQAAEMAERFARLGFPDLALEVLAQRDIETQTAARIAWARATLMTGDPARALALLAGDGSDDAARIRAEAFLAMERYALAAAAFATVDAMDAAARAAWLSGDPETIRRFGTEDQLAFAAQTNLEGAGSSPLPTGTGGRTEPTARADGTGQAGSDPGEPSLAAARALADRSATLRDVLGASF